MSKQTLHFRSSPSILRFDVLPPLSLYIHIPWCVRKCPYCDFNSHTLKGNLPESGYIDALIDDLSQAVPSVWNRPIHSIFIGGGTPSLISPAGYERLLSHVRALCPMIPGAEITLEANPGTLEHHAFEGYLKAGINRLSIGVQSFQASFLKTLGRIHGPEEAFKAVEGAQRAGFKNINLDLMYALPNQSVSQAMADIDAALSCQASHLSWYQLTLEPNTPFYRTPPPIPSHDLMCDIEEAGLKRLALAGFQPYEVSAYTKETPCLHNLNYWAFGDYLGIGAGAHSKITDAAESTVRRSMRHKHPKTYLNDAGTRVADSTLVTPADLSFEFMLNALRLIDGVEVQLFTQRTGLPLSTIEPILKRAHEHGWLKEDATRLAPSKLGRQYLDNLVSLFLEHTDD